MKKLAILVAALFATAAIAQDKAAPKAPEAKAPAAAPKAAAPKAEPAKAPEVKVAGETAKVTATVEAIDQKTREVTLKGPKGNKISFVAGPELTRISFRRSARPGC